MARQVALRKKLSNFKLFKVLKQNGYFLCGVCRRMHKHEEEVLSCLQSCVSHHVSTHQVDAIKRKLKAVEPESYRCKYCKRNYKNSRLQPAVVQQNVNLNLRKSTVASEIFVKVF